MKTKLRKMIFGSLIAGSLLASAGPVMAHDYWHWSERDRRWVRRAELRSDYRDLAAARRQLEYDRRHHASRRRIAEDEARIREIERDIRADRRRF
jgi:outer membrane murein-binding lipoprotein Lpp